VTATRPDALVIEATPHAARHVVSCKILSGHNDANIRRRIDQVLLFCRFRPHLSFGRPVNAGHVLIGFSNVRVRTSRLFFFLLAKVGYSSDSLLRRRQRGEQLHVPLDVIHPVSYTLVRKFLAGRITTCP
jgi:hypothetical protein